MSDETTPAGAPTRAVEGAVEIAATPEQVWRALTDAAELERWFPLEARVEPGEGGSIYMSWKNEYAGESAILVWDPPRHLRTTWGWSDEGPQQVTDYRIEGRGGTTHLRVVTSGFPSDPSWDGWVEGTRLGWRFELASLKHYLERHAGEPRAVVYLRRRVRMPREEAWERLFGAGGLGDRPLGGRPMDVVPPTQYAAILDEPSDAMLRISTEPCLGEPDLRDVTLWLSAWGDAARDIASVEEAWSGRLERLFPEGTSPGGSR
jgi:uncharacterized protein YndB with AHSA1/START domain